MPDPPVPQRKADPVVSSRRWMLLTAAGAAGALGCVGVYLYFLNEATALFTRYLFLGAALYAISAAILRSFQQAGQSRHQRSFETLALALRPQRMAWMIMAALMTVFAITVPIQAFFQKHDSTGLKRYMEIHRQQQAAKKELKELEP